ncbi:helix-turn-helix domain-containing protein [Azotobacter chroococcum]|uniref:Helix-turn-helix domain-containing protein n=1 Tax=Azotobacter chroococcum TaxID=353 RepID=A0AA44C8M0_9GAMM|nr:helix-turn-helix domain-containing protein [Azotobacter chroococcum]NHN79609.1 helix-turn-helix domain-containing protein [Azotobacter chroococcum]
MSALSKAVESVGGPILAAKACGISRQAIDRWLTKGMLPRTEYTGETTYAVRLAAAAAERGFPFNAAWLLAEAAPKKTAA